MPLGKELTDVMERGFEVPQAVHRGMVFDDQDKNPSKCKVISSVALRSELVVILVLKVFIMKKLAP